MALHSRAFLLLRRDLINLQRFPLPGISAQPTDSSDLFHWRAKIEGLAGTIWEGGLFQVTLSFSDLFNSQPPEIHFMTIPFHPNIDSKDGRPCVRLLLSEGGWTEECTVSSVLLSLQAMLSNPELDNMCICNLEAARMIQDSPHTYKQMALDCVTASLRIDAGLTPHELEEDVPKDTISVDSEQKSVRSPETRGTNKRSKLVSFDDYHTLWKGLATSQTVYRQQPSLKSNDQHFSERMWIVDNDDVVPTDLKHGDGHKQSSKKHLEPLSKTKRIEDLKQMYREATTGVTGPPLIYTSTDIEVLPGANQEGKGENSGDEIDKLVEWTKELNEDELLNT